MRQLPSARGLGARLAGGMAGLAALLLPNTPAQAQTLAPSAAPAEWVRYAETATVTITEWLQADSEPAQRLRAYLHATRPAPDQPTSPITLKLWVDAAGTVDRIEFAPFVHDEPNADLNALIVGHSLPAAPPPDMLLPMRIAVQLEAPEAGADTPPAPAAE